MNWENFNRWLTLITNAGVMIGLALLVVELRQSQHLAETDASIRRFEQMQTAQVVMATSESLAEIRMKAELEGPQSLTPAELYRLRRWENSVRLRMQSQYYQYARGYLDKETADMIVAGAVANLAYWEGLGYELGNSEFEQAVRKASGR